MTEPAAVSDGRARLTLVAAIFLLAGCGLIYELVAGALSSYLLGDSVTQFSLVIGVFLAAMGLGSWLTRFLQRDLLTWFVLLEVGVGLIGGLLAPVGFVVFALGDWYQTVLLSGCVLIGTGIGMEIPVVIRLVKEIDTLPVTLARVLSADYIGALAASILFPFLLLPQLGMVRAGVLTGMINVIIAALVLWRLRPLMPGRRILATTTTSAALLILAVVLALTPRLTSWAEDQAYQDSIVLARDTGIQRLVVTRWKDDWRLYLNGHLQFSAVDEHRYHEALVGVPMAFARRRQQVLILGGGDGLAARECLRHRDVDSIDLVDLDPAVTELFTTHPALTKLNGGSLRDPRVTVHNTDAMRFLDNTSRRWDVILIDLPDPSEAGLSKLYSVPFYRLVGRHLAADGIVAVQATSPFRSREAYWCIQRTLTAGLQEGLAPDAMTRPYHTVVPTFGTWGFVLGGVNLAKPTAELPVLSGRFLQPAVLPGLFAFPTDIGPIGEGVSRLDDPLVFKLYRAGYHRYLE